MVIFFRRLIKIDEVSKQVVAGMSYTLRGTFLETSTGNRYAGEVNIWERVWMPDPIVIKFNSKESIDTSDMSNTVAGSS